MLTFRPDVTVRFALEPVDFRKSIDGLAIAVGQALGRDPMGGEVFLFRNRTRTALKALYWTPNGFVLVYKRLEPSIHRARNSYRDRGGHAAGRPARRAPRGRHAGVQITGS
jgi:transposase